MAKSRIWKLQLDKNAIKEKEKEDKPDYDAKEEREKWIENIQLLRTKDEYSPWLDEVKVQGDPFQGFIPNFDDEDRFVAPPHASLSLPRRSPFFLTFPSPYLSPYVP